MKHFTLIILAHILFIATQTGSLAQGTRKLIPVPKGDKYGLMDAKKNLVVDYRYDFISPFRNGLAIVKVNGKSGIINASGKEVVPVEFDAVTQPEKGYTIVTKGDSSNVTDTASRFLLGEWYYRIDTAGAGFYRIKNHCKVCGSHIRNTITYFGLEAAIGLHRDSVWFSDILIGYFSPANQSLNGIWFSGGERVEKGKIKVAISKRCFFVDTLGVLTPRAPDPCDRSLMNIYRPDVWPEYPVENEPIQSFINRNFKFPEGAIVHHHNGKVLANLTIDREGNVTGVRILKSVSPEYDAAVIEVYSKLPRWKPAQYNGMPVCAEATVEFTFMIGSMK